MKILQETEQALQSDVMKPRSDEGDITPDITLDAYNGVILDATDDPTVEDKKNVDPSQLFTLRICRKIKFVIFKPLIPLKISLFLWFGAGAVLQPFISVYLKQRGMTLSELSLIYIITPPIQLLASVMSGVVADKIGRSKPVLVANLLLMVIFLASCRLVPSMGQIDCENMPVDLRCHRLQFNRLIAEASCGIDSDPFQVRSCHVSCPENVTQYCAGQNLICELLDRRLELSNFSLSIHVNSSYTSKGECFYNVNALTHSNSTYSWCDVPHKMYCSISCTLLPDEKCSLQKEYRTRLYIGVSVLTILFMVMLSNTYRIFDVTAMCLVKDYNKDFGKERIWGILGVLVFSPLGGLLVTVTSIDGDMKNYTAAFYFGGALALVTLVATWKLKVQIRSPGKHLWTKSLKLLKNPDVISFALILLVLGGTWGYCKLFMSWYLEEDLKAPSFLIGLLPAVSSLYGIPFLQTSKWWVNKIGHTNIFLLALLGGMLSTLGYSFLYDPWWSIALEVSNIVTYHLLWVAVILHSHSLAPEGLTATVISSAGGIHYGIGKSSGTLIGGLSMDAYGGRVAFRIISGLCLGTAVLYALYLFFRQNYVRKAQKYMEKNQPSATNTIPERNKNELSLQDTQTRNENE